MLASCSRLLRDFNSLFYPNCCPGCGRALLKGEKVICSACLVSMPQTDFHLHEWNQLARRLYGRFPVSNALAFLKFTKNGRIQHLLHSLKYRNQPEIGLALGTLYGGKLAEAGFKGRFDVIIPVPLHPTRLRKRGYNQSQKFAEGLSSILEVPVDNNALYRRLKTSTQTRKSKLERWENVSDVFGFRTDAPAPHRHVLLADDVITTGATVEACATTLLQHVPCQVSVVCIAVA